ncbi:unnamed protein product [Protopolystoma xenopodis]|uniref:Uncharacterized protein n=1 Tax=Protopolystoma xenopodis TaxID=117903 RepID=A0A3S5BS17_9PLAT|nr:unnamed protein product [Protopolystoma xenopodis]
MFVYYRRKRRMREVQQKQQRQVRSSQPAQVSDQTCLDPSSSINAASRPTIINDLSCQSRYASSAATKTATTASITSAPVDDAHFTRKDETHFTLVSAGIEADYANSIRPSAADSTSPAKTSLADYATSTTHLNQGHPFQLPSSIGYRNSGAVIHLPTLNCSLGSVISPVAVSSSPTNRLPNCSVETWRYHAGAPRTARSPPGVLTEKITAGYNFSGSGPAAKAASFGPDLLAPVLS